MRQPKVLFYNLTILFVLFLFFEIGFRLLNPDYQYYEQTYIGQFENSTAIEKLDTNWVEKDLDLGWVCKQKTNLNFYDSTFHSIQYNINTSGFRNPTDFDSLATPKSKKRILLIGDSFLFGIFLEESMTIRSQLQKRLGAEFEVITLAVPAWGLDQMYLSYKKYIKKIDPDQVMVLLIDDDVSRVVEALYWGAATKPAYKLEDEKMILKDSLEGKLNGFEAAFAFNSKISNKIYQHTCLRKAEPLAAAFLNQWKAEESARGKSLKVLHFPRIEQVGPTVGLRHDFENIFAPNDYLIVEKQLLQLNETQLRQLYIPGDGHPSAAGAEFIAKLLYELIMKNTQIVEPAKVN